MDEATQEEQLFNERGKKIKDFFKNQYAWITIACLVAIVVLSIHIRTLPMQVTSSGHPGLWDITKNSWTLGPDLDPYLFLRWAKYIVEHGSIMPIDTMRNVPLHFNTASELLLISYGIAWFHKIAVMFGSPSVDYSAVLYPVIAFSLTIIAFFFFTRKLVIDFVKPLQANLIALVASLFLTLLPPLLPRTIAGIPEKESTAFLFLFLAFYFFLSAWKSKEPLKVYIFSVLAGLATAAMAFTWGGYAYIFVTFGVVMLIAFVLGQVDKQKFLIFTIWLFSSIVVMYPLSNRYTLTNLLTSTVTALSISVFPLLCFHFLIFETKLKYFFSSERWARVPRQIITIVVFIIVGLVLIIAFFGLGFVKDKYKDIAATMITPTTSRFGVTVAENRQPYFSEWAGSFGPSLYEVARMLSPQAQYSPGTIRALSTFPLFFWLFFLGSVYVFYLFSSEFSPKERLVLTASYTFFLVCLIFSRYSTTSRLNGVNALSTFVYALGFIVLVSSFGYYYFRSHKTQQEERLRKLNFGKILLFVFFFLSIVSARGSVRTIMVLVPAAAIFASYLVVGILDDAFRVKENPNKTILWILALIIFLSGSASVIYFYQVSHGTAQGYIPGPYNQQWQKAMAWTRENTPQNAVFGHWWDYGYWLQSIGERATVLDGGNSIVYWNHLMGRYGLTGADNYAAVDFLYSHNTTHFLIDSTDIGKYPAYSSIGSDVGYDRRSWISTFIRDDVNIRETKNATIYSYVIPRGDGTLGINPLDGDITYDINGTTKYLPSGNAGILGVTIELGINNTLTKQPQGIFIYQGKQMSLPLRYAYFNKQFVDFGSGIESVIFLIPRLIQDNKGARIEKNSALLFLSNRTVKSQFARLYLYNEDNPYFELVHSEDDFVVAQLKEQYGFNEDFILFNDIRGPIRIWEIHYPDGLKVKEEYLRTTYPDKRLEISDSSS